MLVAAVVMRNTAVQPSSRFALISPKTTTNPEPIPTRLNTTCTKVIMVMVKSPYADEGHTIRTCEGREDPDRIHYDHSLRVESWDLRGRKLRCSARHKNRAVLRAEKSIRLRLQFVAMNISSQCGRNTYGNRVRPAPIVARRDQRSSQAGLHPLSPGWVAGNWELPFSSLLRRRPERGSPCADAGSDRCWIDSSQPCWIHA